MTLQMEAILMIAKHPLIEPILLPLIDPERETIHWSRLKYGVLSGGEKAAISWAWCIWTDTQIPHGKAECELANLCDLNWRDPFDCFGVMGGSLQRTVLAALSHRWGVRS